MDTMANEMIGARRRRYGEDLKRQILAECQTEGASIAKVAIHHGANANLAAAGLH